MKQLNMFGGYNPKIHQKTNRIKVAQETVHISNKGWYIIGSRKIVLDKNLSSHRVPIEQLKSKTYDGGNFTPQYCVIPQTTGEAIFSLAKKYKQESIGVLNFASARQMGGGFLQGAMAQEEALCYCSNLYKAQQSETYYYDINKKTQNGLYTDEMFMSNHVSFFRDDNYKLVFSPVVVGSVLTVPAVNHMFLAAEYKDRADEVMLNRIRLLIKAFINEGNTTLILGAWGCGVFGNNPQTVAKQFKQILVDEKLGTYFENIIFAIPDRSDGNFVKFKEVWN